MGVQIVFKYLAAGFGAFLMAPLLKTKGVVDIRITLHNESGGVIVKLVDMGPYPTVLGFLKNKGKSILKCLPGSQPDKLIAAHIHAAGKALQIGVTDS